MLITEDIIRKRFSIDTESEPSSHHARTASFEQPAGRTAHLTDRSSVAEYDNDPESAFRRIERWLSVRDRSIAETKERLQRERFTDKAINEALERAIRCGYLDDARFAEGFIRSRLRASKGIEGIVRDLKDHRIDATSIPGFPDTFLEEQGGQLENAIRLLERKPPRAKNKRQAAYAKLIRNGFSSAIASSAVKAWSEGLE